MISREEASRQYATGWRVWPAHLPFLLNFAAGKGLAFSAPLLAGLLISTDLYGDVEFGLAVAQGAAVALGLGLPGAVMQMIVLRGNREPVVDLLAACVATASVLSLCAAFAAWRAGAGGAILACALLLGPCAAQQSGVAYARARGWRNGNVWVDHAPLLVALALACGLTLSGAPGPTPLWGAIAGLDGLLALASFALLARTAAPRPAGRLRGAVRFGAPVLGAMLASLGVMSAGRIALGSLGSADDLFAYAYGFRVASVVVLLHALAMTGFARALYAMPTRRFDRAGAGLTVAFAIVALGVVVVDPALWLMTARGAERAASFAARGWRALIPLQVFLWTAGALIEQRIARARLASRAMVAQLFVFAACGGCALALFVSDRLTAGAIVGLAVVLQGLACAAQHVLLAHRGLPLRKSQVAAVLGTIAILGAIGLRQIAAG